MAFRCCNRFASHASIENDSLVGGGQEWLACRTSEEISCSWISLWNENTTALFSTFHDHPSSQVPSTACVAGLSTRQFTRTRNPMIIWVPLCWIFCFHHLCIVFLAILCWLIHIPFTQKRIHHAFPFVHGKHWYDYFTLFLRAISGKNETIRVKSCGCTKFWSSSTSFT